MWRVRHKAVDGWVLGAGKSMIIHHSAKCGLFFFLFVQRNFGNITALVPLAIIAEVILYRG